jgi:site-specific DNA-methyltransferase (adenine-specific)
VNAYYTDDRVSLYHGDCIEVMRQLPDNSVDAVVTDPPYLLDFMGKGWDSADGIAGKPEVWKEALRVLKPGGHLLAFGGTRTWHRLAVAIEDAGFEVRDSVAWMYGSGFPKSHDVSKAIDKRAGVEREKVRIDAREVRNPKAIGNGTDGMEGGTRPWIEAAMERGYHEKDSSIPATPAAEQWQGWGTALKPAHEPIVVARKPLIGTVAENVLTHGTGALNIDGCRIGTQEMMKTQGAGTGVVVSKSDSMAGAHYERINAGTVTGRWPANVILDEPQAAELDKQSGVSKDGVAGARTGAANGYEGGWGGQPEHRNGYGGQGGASRFFYVAKASKKERPNVDGVAHPTVKPMALMRYLVRLVTPPGGTVLEPFAGSGTTIEAALEEGFNVIGIEMTDEYLPLILARIERYGEKLC